MWNSPESDSGPTGIQKNIFGGLEILEAKIIHFSSFKIGAELSLQHVIEILVALFASEEHKYSQISPL